MGDKVFCGNCEFLRRGDGFCCHAPENHYYVYNENWYSDGRQHAFKSTPKKLNKFNVCKYYKVKSC